MCEVLGRRDMYDERSTADVLLQQERELHLIRWIESDAQRDSKQLMAGVLWRNDLQSRNTFYLPKAKKLFRGRMPLSLAVHLTRRGVASEQFAVRRRIAIDPTGAVYEVLSEHGEPLRLGEKLVDSISPL